LFLQQPKRITQRKKGNDKSIWLEQKNTFGNHDNPIDRYNSICRVELLLDSSKNKSTKRIIIFTLTQIQKRKRNKGPPDRKELRPANRSRRERRKVQAKRE
jgi:hypothetical protein